MPIKESTVRTICLVVDTLERLHADKEIAFILATKELQKENKVHVYLSPDFNDKKLELLRSLIENGISKGDNICEIRPALKHSYMLLLNKRSTQQLLDQYYNLMSALSQAVCKSIAKEWIKVAEPKKQALYPYKFFNLSKPPWWPAKVNHIEPDHLDKDSRINVLINILRNPSFDLEALKLRTSILEFKYPVTSRLLHEVYYLAAYDRLFYGHGRENELQAGLLAKLSEGEKEKILSGEVGIMVSDIRGASAIIKQRGLVMVSQIKESWLNDSVFVLNQSPVSSHATTVIKPEQDVKDEPESKENTDTDTDSDVECDIEHGSLMFSAQEALRRKRSNNQLLACDSMGVDCTSASQEPPSAKLKFEDLGESIKMKNSFDYISDIGYDTMSQEIVQQLDSTIGTYTSTPSSDELYMPSAFEA